MFCIRVFCGYGIAFCVGFCSLNTSQDFGWVLHLQNELFCVSGKIKHRCVSLSLSSVFCCRAGSGYPNGYPVLGHSRGGFTLPSSWFVITYCDQSFPSPWHCLSAAPSLSGATLLSTLEGVPLSATRGCGWSP